MFWTFFFMSCFETYIGSQLFYFRIFLSLLNGFLDLLPENFVLLLSLRHPHLLLNSHIGVLGVVQGLLLGVLVGDGSLHPDLPLPELELALPERLLVRGERTELHVPEPLALPRHPVADETYLFDGAEAGRTLGPHLLLLGAEGQVSQEHRVGQVFLVE